MLCGAVLRGEVRVQRAAFRPGFILCCNSKDVIGGVDVSEEFRFDYGEGAPIHIGEDVARRCGPTLVIELLWRFEMVCAWRMLLAAWRRVSTLASLFNHPRERALSFKGCLVFTG